jgi:hypothetical protein
MWERFSFTSMPSVRLNLDDLAGPGELGVTVNLAMCWINQNQ